MTEPEKTYDTHLADFQKTAHVKGMDAYRELYRE